ncbi:hypothetical protein J7L67_02035 [bacterium]|nr:hypothetical protein [bacterium]
MGILTGRLFTLDDIAEELGVPRATVDRHNHTIIALGDIQFTTMRPYKFPEEEAKKYITAYLAFKKGNLRRTRSSKKRSIT